jgi:hypothetical protein
MEDEELVNDCNGDINEDDKDGKDDKDNNGGGASFTNGKEWQGTPTGRRFVRLRLDKLSGLADEIEEQQAKTKTKTKPSAATTDTNSAATTSNNDTSWIEWDEEGWHYSGQGFKGNDATKRERIALYLLALDAINFCFWPLPDKHFKPTAETSQTTSAPKEPAQALSTNKLEYDHLASAMKAMAEADHCIGSGDNNSTQEYVFSPKNLASMNADQMKSLFASHLDVSEYPLPNIAKRAGLWNQVGDVLLNNFGGSATALLEACGGDASNLVELVTTWFPGFRDEVILPSLCSSSSSSSSLPQPQRIVFLKRAQILVGDLDAALGLRLGGMDRLTTFADYRVPQILRHKGILEYAPTLADRVNRQFELARGSFEEVSIRAATVVAVEELVRVLNRPRTTARTHTAPATTTEPTNHRDKDNNNNDDNNNSNNTNPGGFTDVTVDWYLWQVGERMHQEGILEPFHRVRTHFY